MALTLDEKDTKLLKALQKNARISTSALARKMKLSRTTVQDRITRLEERKIIAGYTVKLDPSFTARQMSAHVMMKIEPKAQDAIVDHCSKMDRITALYTIAGEFDLIAVAEANTTEGLDRALDEIRNIKGVTRTTTSVVLSKKLER